MDRLRQPSQEAISLPPQPSPQSNKAEVTGSIGHKKSSENWGTVAKAKRAARRSQASGTLNSNSLVLPSCSCSQRAFRADQSGRASLDNNNDGFTHRLRKMPPPSPPVATITTTMTAITTIGGRSPDVLTPPPSPTPTTISTFADTFPAKMVTTTTTLPTPTTSENTSDASPNTTLPTLTVRRTRSRPVLVAVAPLRHA
ncbi:hypothetical protein SprV_0301314600 [Sparganum proliferum]